MNLCPTRSTAPRYVRHWPGALLLALACAGCGGGSSTGDTPLPDTDPASPPADEAVLQVAVAHSSSSGPSVVLWDPAAPGTVLGTAASDSASTLASLDVVSVDGPNQFRFQRSVIALTLQQGRLVGLDLQSGHTHLPRQISSLDGIQALGSSWPLDPSGQVGWLSVRTSTGDTYALRTDLGSGDAPLALGTGQVLELLKDAQGTAVALALLIHDHTGSWLDFRDVATGQQSLTRVAVPSGPWAWLGSDPLEAGLGHVILGGHLRAVRWSGGSVTIDAAAPGEVSGTVTASTRGASASYFSEGRTIHAVSSDNSLTTLATLSADLTTESPFKLLDAGDYLVTQRSSVDFAECCLIIDSVRKSDGQQSTLYSSIPGPRVLGEGSGWLVLTGLADGSATAHDAVVMRGDGGERRSLGTFAGVVRNRLSRPGQAPTLTAVLTCTPWSEQASYCGPGDVTQWDLATGTSVVLGRLEGHGSLDVQAWEGRTATLTLTQGLPPDEARDAWQFTAGQAQSLVRVTRNLP